MNLLSGFHCVGKPVRQRRRLNLAKSAFTIIEVMIGSALVGVLFLALFAAFGFGFRVIQIARESLRATQILEEKMETIRLYTWEQVNTAGFVPATFSSTFSSISQGGGGPTYTGAVSIADAPLTETYKNDIKLIKVTVDWKSGGVPRHRAMETLVSQYGIQNYKYY